MELDGLRFAYLPENTQGQIIAGDFSCFTIERPWLRWSFPGGQPFESCIPDGQYDLIPYIRQNGDRAFAMVNEGLGVYFASKDRPKDALGNHLGRFKCLIHGRANYVGDVQGCAAVGRARIIDPRKHEQMVTQSTHTMLELLKVVPWEHGHTINIRPAPGATEHAA